MTQCVQAQGALGITISAELFARVLNLSLVHRNIEVTDPPAFKFYSLGMGFLNCQMEYDVSGI